MANPTTLIIGANSEIAKALALQTVHDNNKALIVITRDPSFYQQPSFTDSKVITLADYQEHSIIEAIDTIKAGAETLITNVFICHGLLHNQRVMPEKRLQAFNVDSFNEVINANTITPMLWLKNLVPYLSGKQACKIIIFSARVGSISDNKIGGWYSYRASKAATNMLLKSAAIELARSAKNIKLISFHPGTTDSPLSKPFQKNVPEGKLFTREFVASQLFKIVEESQLDGQVSFLDWQGKEIPW
ncbi:SDR family NAD(P)-dependent oxidoreductase [Psychromonas aquatilis]|uniref:SDR family NAD(P)-dependent oxidoreductase n=1 Tax=Psychromonas aquatilis TaxID=2005072 RepID=A0ABU9GTR1_9GAMM